jgi:hypothetical protein
VNKRAARTVANVVLLSAGAAAAYVVYTTPPLRVLAGIAGRRWLGGSLSAFLLTQARQAWVESGQRTSPSPPPHETVPEALDARSVR